MFRLETWFIGGQVSQEVVVKEVGSFGFYEVRQNGSCGVGGVKCSYRKLALRIVFVDGFKHRLLVCFAKRVIDMGD
jgi:hypothetical protein